MPRDADHAVSWCPSEEVFTVVAWLNFQLPKVELILIEQMTPANGLTNRCCLGLVCAPAADAGTPDRSQLPRE